MNFVFDNKFLYVALTHLNMIYEQILTNPSSLQDELTETLKINERYKFKEIAGIQSEIEKLLYNLLLKLQSYSVMCSAHNLCVKFFLMKGKFLLALKSLLFLQKNFGNSFEYLESLHMLVNYIKDNSTNKINEEYIKLADEKVNLKQGERLLRELKMNLLSERNPLVLAENKFKVDKLFKERNFNFNDVTSEVFKASKQDLRSVKQVVRIKSDKYMLIFLRILTVSLSI